MRASDRRDRSATPIPVSSSIREFDVKHLIILASLATIGGVGASRAADATPMPALFRVATIDEESSTCITPSTEGPLLTWARSRR